MVWVRLCACVVLWWCAVVTVWVFSAYGRTWQKRRFVGIGVVMVGDVGREK